MKTFKRIAESAVSRLALEMVNSRWHSGGNWPEIDRIEKRFDIQGCGEIVFFAEIARRDAEYENAVSTWIRENWDVAFHCFTSERIRRAGLRLNPHCDSRFLLSH